MTWNVEVAESGRYEAIINYASPAADIGAAVELRLNEAVWAGKITTAHDPQLRGQEQDRVPRGAESYVKDFKPLTLGAADLSAGRGVLTLRATSIPGAGVADIRSVTLVRLAAAGAAN